MRRYLVALVLARIQPDVFLIALLSLLLCPITAATAGQVQIQWQFSPDDLRLERIGEYTTVALPDAMAPQERPGTPSLPARYVFVLVPAGSVPTDLKIAATETIAASNVLIQPSQPPRTTNDPPSPFTPPDPAAYASNAKTPESLGVIQGTHRLHGYTLVALRLNPIRYAAASRELYLATSIEATLTYDDSSASRAKAQPSAPLSRVQPRGRAEVVELVSNAQDVDRFAPAAAPASASISPGAKQANGPSGDGTAVYLLITNESLAPAFQPLVDRRTAQGKTGKLVTTEWIYANYEGTRPDGGTDDQTKIRNCIIDHYQNNGTVWVVLGGDETVVPLRYGTEYHVDQKPADLYYACLDGTWDEDLDGLYGEAGDDDADLIPEVWIGRISVTSAEPPDPIGKQATDYINKLIRYETRSPDGFANSMLLASEYGGVLSGLARPAGYRDRDPVDSGEVATLELYRNSVQPYWHGTPTDELFQFNTTWDEFRCGDYDVNGEHLLDRLSWGYHHFFAFAHGTPQGIGFELIWLSPGLAAALTNTDRPSIMYTVACSTAAIDLGDPTVCEALIRNPGGGAVAYIGASRSQGATVYTAELFYKELFQNHPPTLGEVFGRHKMAWLAGSSSDGMHRGNQFIINLHGDSALALLGEEGNRHLQMLSPKGCEVIDIDADITIRWNAAGTGFAPSETVRLDYSPDGGANWLPVPGAENLPYNGRLFTWQHPYLAPGSQYRTRATAISDPGVTDESNRDFTIGSLAILTVRSTPNVGLWIIGTHFNATDYTYNVLLGSGVTLTAPSHDGKLDFVRWTNGEGNVLSDDPTCNFTLSADTTVIAEYAYAGNTTDYYVNDDVAEPGFAAGDDANDGLSHQTPVRHIQTLLSRPCVGWGDVIHVSTGVYAENLILTLDRGNAIDNGGLTLLGAGADLTTIDGGQKGSCLILNGAATASIQGLTLRNGKATFGGGFYCGSPCTITDCIITDNSASTHHGGGIYCAIGGGATITHCTITHNSAAMEGGGICCEAPGTTVTNCTIASNSAGFGGGALLAASGPTVTDCTFTDNSAGFGGAIYCMAPSGVIRRCTITGNSATSRHGGGIYCGNTSDLTIGDCTITNNSASMEGGGITLENISGAMVSNCAIAVNSALFGGGVFWVSSSGAMHNCTLRGNLATASGGGTYFWDSGASLHNCILWNDAPDEAYINSGAPVVTFSDVQGGWSGAGTGNIDVDPLFLDSSGGNCQLQAGSPCIDAGNNADVPNGIVKDLAGHLRFFDDLTTPDCRWAPGTCGMAPIVDMGAHEYIPAIPGDNDGDGDVDGADLAFFEACASGPAIPLATGCEAKDLDDDNDVDQSDFGTFQRCLSGENVPADPNCAN